MNARDLPAEVTRLLDEHNLGSLLDQAQEALVYMDDEWVVRYCNDVYLRNVGQERSAVMGHTPFEYLPGFKRSIFYETVATALRERKQTARIGFSTVLNRWLLVRCMPFPQGGGLMLANDATESVVQQYQLAQQALKDTLTGLPNKLALTEDLSELMQTGAPFSLALVGLTRFRSVNDALGFAKGEQVLMKVASCLQSTTVEGERLFRLGGDEFAVLSTRGFGETAMRLTALLTAADRPVDVDGQSFVLGAAAGVVFDADADAGDDVEVLLKRASLALREAESGGRERFRCYEAAMEAASRKRLQLEAELRRAVANGEFTLVLQPKGDLQRRSVVGAEALIRWPHATRGMVPPGDFLPVAQECGLMVEIDRWVLEHSLQQVAALSQRGIEMPVSINLSVESLGDTSLVQNVSQALARHGIESRLLEIEIPEGALMRDVDVSSRVLGALHDLGVAISIDDFGTGYSSFAYLALFPVQTLKIDRSFVSDMTTNNVSLNIVKGLVRLAHSLGMKVVAEGAETEAEMKALQRMQCDSVQGYGYGRPMPFDSFVEFVRRQPPASTMSAMTL